jgi:hypothetical protein
MFIIIKYGYLKKKNLYFQKKKFYFVNFFYYFFILFFSMNSTISSFSLYNKLGIPLRFIAFFLTHFFTQNDILLNIFQYQKRWRARKGSNKGLYFNRFIRKCSNIKAATSESVIFRKKWHVQ